ncbi:GntR family carbon starvation induced transcriptional regulator [Bradyrhizobium sp. GM0.4]
MTSLEGRPLSAGDSGYQRIRSDIIFGVLTPSGRLKLDAMKEDYGVSISTLREILNRLTSEGFVVAEGQRGFEVAPISIQNLRELAGLRILLEQHAMAESFRAGDVEWEGRVVSAHHKLAATERTVLKEGDDPELRKRYDGEFHQALISNCGSRELMQTHAIVFDKYFRYALRYRGAETINPAQGAARMRPQARHQKRQNRAHRSHQRVRRARPRLLERGLIVRGLTSFGDSARRCNRISG